MSFRILVRHQFGQAEEETLGFLSILSMVEIDKTDKESRFVAVKVKFKKKFKNTITLDIIKKTKEFKNLPLIKQSRLSVMPVDFKSWKTILNMGRI